MAGTGHAYTYDGKRKSSMTHARRSWTCPCGKVCWGNGGKSSHQRACDVWAKAELARLERLTADKSLSWTQTWLDWADRRDRLRERLGVS
jgi:hypothetical protein